MKKTYVTVEEIELAKKNGTVERLKARLVDRMIGERYTVGDQIALLRQREEKPDEYAAFYAFAETCKAHARICIEDPVAVLG